MARLPYDNLTLAKGCGYPVFIAAASLLGLGLPLAEQLIYLTGCWLVVASVRPAPIKKRRVVPLSARSLVWQRRWVDFHGWRRWRYDLAAEPLHSPHPLFFCRAYCLKNPQRPQRPCQIGLGRSAWPFPWWSLAHPRREHLDHPKRATSDGRVAWMALMRIKLLGQSVLVHRDRRCRRGWSLS